MKRVAEISFDGEKARLRESYENLSVRHAQAMRLLRRVLDEVTEDQDGDWVYTHVVTDILEDIKAFLDTKEDRPMEIEDALWLVRKNAIAHRNKNAKLRTILAEVAELAYALDGEHEHPPKYELIQIAGICVNWITRIKED